MMAMLGWLESTAFSVWVREGETIWAFPTILTLHTFGLGLLVGTAAVVNLRLLGLGIGPRLPLSPLRSLFGVMWGGFWLNLVTGSMLFVADASRRGPSVLFWTKILFVAIGISTTVLIKRAVFDTPADPTVPEPPARTLALLSLFAWTAAIVAGRLLAYV